MGKRRKGREIVLQACYASRIAGSTLAAAVADQLDRRLPGPETADFARDLATKVAGHGPEIEGWLADLVQNWEPERLGVVERTILQIALTELRHCPDVPWRVVINEACELARRFCDDQAVGFVNGVLDRAARETLAAEGGRRSPGPGGDGPGPANGGDPA